MLEVAASTWLGCCAASAQTVWPPTRAGHRQHPGPIAGARRRPQHLIDIEGETRESFSVVDQRSGEEFRFVLPGPNLTQREWQSALTWLTDLSPTPGYLVLSGSLPPGVPDDFYAQVVCVLKASTTRIVLDASGAPLRLALQTGGVHLFKPSLRELEELTGQVLPENAVRIAAARRLISQQQAAWVALSLGEEGALLVRINTPG